MRSADFWAYFDRVARPKLNLRAEGFSKIFSYLDRLDRPVIIVETGCARRQESWEGDGQSTLLFDKYCEFHPDSQLFSVDIDRAAAAACRALVGPRTRIHAGDSVAFLKSLADDASVAGIDLLYLDSLDANPGDPVPGALHALKEVLAAAPLLAPDTLVVADDSPITFQGVINNDGTVRTLGSSHPGGRARFLGDYAMATGAEPFLSGYQCGWLGIGRQAPRPAADAGGDDGAGGKKPTDAPARPRTKMTDLLTRMTDAMSRRDRMTLALRLIETEIDEIICRRDGIRWTVFPWDELISWQVLADGGFQTGEVRRVVAWLSRRGRLARPRDTIVDIGANIGTSTIPLARWTDCRIIAIEPVPEVFALLGRNVADNGLTDRVTCIETAISRTPGPVRMVSPARNSGGGEIVRPNIAPSFAGAFALRGTVEVPTIGLGELLDAQGVAPERIALVWSDTQGCEAEVIETGQALWAAGTPLFAEWDPSVWGNAAERDRLVAAAETHFSGFIPSMTLATDVDAVPRPIAELTAFTATLERPGTDILLLPETDER